MIRKPMNAREILNKSLKSFKGQYMSYLGVAGLGIGSILGLGLLVVALYYWVGKEEAMLGGTVFFFLAIAVNFAMNGGIIKMASEQILDREISSMEAYQFGFSKVWHIFIGTVLYFIIVCIGGIVLIIPGVYLGNAFVFFAHNVIIEDDGPWNAIKRSKELTKGSWWRCLGILLLTGVLVLLISVLPRIAIESLGALIIELSGSEFIISFVNNMIGLCAACLFQPLFMIGMTLLYYDLKICKENIDLQVAVVDEYKQ